MHLMRLLAVQNAEPLVQDRKMSVDSEELQMFIRCEEEQATMQPSVSANPPP
jgi:hypothetical protein